VAFWQSMAFLTSIGWLLAIPIAAGVLAGHYVDVWLGTGTRWTLALLGAGIVVGVMEAYLAGRRALGRRKDGRGSR
jgi:ATP synthase protein I